MCEQRKSHGSVSSLKAVCEGLQGVGGGGGAVRGEKVLQLNYIVCVEDRRADGS